MQATCLVPYIGTLLSQIWMEGYFTKKGRQRSFRKFASTQEVKACAQSPWLTVCKAVVR